MSKRWWADGDPWVRGAPADFDGPGAGGFDARRLKNGDVVELRTNGQLRAEIERLRRRLAWSRAMHAVTAACLIALAILRWL